MLSHVDTFNDELIIGFDIISATLNYPERFAIMMENTKAPLVVPCFIFYKVDLDSNTILFENEWVVEKQQESLYISYCKFGVRCVSLKTVALQNCWTNEILVAVKRNENCFCVDVPITELVERGFIVNRVMLLRFSVEKSAFWLLKYGHKSS